jgi:hypothetical protein
MYSDKERRKREKERERERERNVYRIQAATIRGWEWAQRSG